MTWPEAAVWIAMSAFTLLAIVAMLYLGLKYHG